jgi:hypothetical protein
MYALYRLAAGRVLAIALVIALGGFFGSPSVQASEEQGCQSCPQTCPAPVVREKTTLPAAACCAAPVDPKEISKARKEAEHAQHEAAEACERQQKAVAKAQRDLDKAQAKANKDIEKHNEKLAKRNAELAEANARLESLTEPTVGLAATEPCEPTVGVCEQPSAPVAQEATPEPSTEQPEEMAVVITPAPPEPAPQPEQLPSTSEQTTQAQETAPAKELPKTASPMSLLGLIGLLSMSGYVTRFFRR